MANAIILRKLDGERFGAIGKGSCLATRWENIQRIVADEFRVRPDDVSISEGDGLTCDDEGLEYLTVDGERVAFLDEQIGQSPDYSETIPVFQMAAE